MQLRGKAVVALVAGLGWIKEPRDDSQNEERDTDKKKRAPSGPKVLETGGIDELLVTGSGAATNLTLLKEAIIMTLQKVSLNLAHGVKKHTHGDQHTGATEENGYAERHVVCE